MDAQLHLLPDPPPITPPITPPSDESPVRSTAPASWHLGDDDRDVGRRGVATARAALRAARRAAAEPQPSAA
jgi:hypothetical protein